MNVRHLHERSHCPSAAIVFSLLAGPALAAPGDLDPGFGVGGRVSLQPVPRFVASSGIQQADGRLVVVGTALPDGRSGMAPVIVRFEADGTLDRGFGNSGVATGLYTAGAGDELLQQADGKLVVAGRTVSPGHIALWRFTVDGLADSSFGLGGTASLDLRSDGVSGLVQQPDGRLVVAITNIELDGAGSVTDSDMALARVHPDGRLDTAFGDGGVQRVAFPDGDGEEWAGALVQQPDGRLLILGGREDRVAIARTLADGPLDATFGDGGLLVMSALAGFARTGAYAAGTEAAGTIVVTGTTFNHDMPGDATIGGFALRIRPDGSPDPGFGRDGVARTIRPILASAIEPGGAILAAIRELRGGGLGDMALMRLQPDGSADLELGVGGRSIADFGRPDLVAFSRPDAMLRQADGKIVVIGTSYDCCYWDEVSPAPELAMARFSEVDPGFPGVIGLLQDHVSVAEKLGTVTLRVRRTGGSTGAVSVQFSTVEPEWGSIATADADFVSKDGRLQWADGDTSERSIELSAIDDATIEGAEGFWLQLFAPTNGAALSTTDAYVQVVDDDDPGSPAPVPGPPTLGRSTGGGGSGAGLLLLAVPFLGLAGKRWPTCRRAASPGRTTWCSRFGSRGAIQRLSWRSFGSRSAR